MIGYVYLVCLLILFLLRIAIRLVVDLLGWSNAFGLRNTIARERGIAAYRAWVPLERIRPADRSAGAMGGDIRLARRQQAALSAAGAADLRGAVQLSDRALSAWRVLLQIFTPFPVLTWLGRLARMLAG